MKFRLQELLKNLKKEIIQDIPDELAACEVCGATDCRNDEWIHCENRIAHEKCLRQIAERNNR